MLCLLAFAQAVKVKRVLEADAADPPQTFWRYLMGLMADKAAIEWSKVFGSMDNDTHWTKVIPEGDHQAVREGLYSELKMDEAGWVEYRASVIDYRNQMAAHHDLQADLAKYPHYDNALLAAYYMYGSLQKLLTSEDGAGLPESLGRWSDGVSKNMSVIIRHAFAGSAHLGSNMPNRAQR